MGLGDTRWGRDRDRRRVFRDEKGVRSEKGNERGQFRVDGKLRGRFTVKETLSNEGERTKI